MKAMEVIDAGYFSRETERSTEKFWRRLSKPERKFGVVTSAPMSGERYSPFPVGSVVVTKRSHRYDD